MESEPSDHPLAELEKSLRSGDDSSRAENLLVLDVGGRSFACAYAINFVVRLITNEECAIRWRVARCRRVWLTLGIEVKWRVGAKSGQRLGGVSLEMDVADVALKHPRRPFEGRGKLGRQHWAECPPATDRTLQGDGQTYSERCVSK